MDSLKDVLKAEMNKYAVKGFLGEDTYFSADEAQQLYLVFSIYDEDNKRTVDTFLVSRLVNEIVIIEQDMNDKPLVDALVQAGVPREQIILVYAGEKVPNLV